MRKPASREITSAFVELCETEVCFLHIQLIGTCDFRKCTGFLVMLTRNLQSLLQNQRLEMHLICIVVLCFPHDNIACRLLSLSFSPAHWHGYETHPGAITFPPRSRLFVESLSTGPSAFRNTFSVSTITDCYARIRSRNSCLPLRRPDCTWSRLRAEEYDRPVTQ